MKSTMRACKIFKSLHLIHVRSIAKVLLVRRNHESLETSLNSSFAELNQCYNCGSTRSSDSMEVRSNLDFSSQSCICGAVERFPEGVSLRSNYSTEKPYVKPDLA